MGKSDITRRPTKWRIITSSGWGVSIGEVLTLGGTTGKLYLSKEFEDAPDSPGVVILSYFGFGPGAGVSVAPADVSHSNAKMWSDGFIYHGTLSNGSDIELKDLTGSCVVRVTTVSGVVAGSLTEVFFQPQSSLLPTRCKAVGIVFGTGLSVPGVGQTDYFGYMRISKVNPLQPEDKMEPDIRPAHFQTIPPTLTLPADTLFDFDSSKLKPAAVSSLKQALALIVKQRVRSVVIEGHTDAKGTAQYNVTLSEARAQSVKNWLVGQNAPNASGFVTKGMGKSQPVAPNSRPDGSDNPEGRQQNRRVAIFLLT